MVLSKERIKEELSRGNIRINSIDRNSPFNEGVQIQGSSVDLYLAINNPITIKPGQTIALKSREIIYMSDKLTGFIAPRRRWMEKGVFVGSGYIQSGDMNQLDVFVSNISDHDVTINPNDSIYQIIFFEVIPSIKRYEKTNLLSIIKDIPSVLDFLVSSKRDVEKPPAYPDVWCLQGKYWEDLEEGKQKGIFKFLFYKIVDFFWRLPIFPLLAIWFLRGNIFTVYGIFFLLISLLFYRGFWIFIDILRMWLDGIWKNHIYPLYLYKEPSPQLRDEWMRSSGVNIIYFIAFIVFIFYIELFFWYLAFYTILGKSIVDAFRIFKAPIDWILLPFSLGAYGDKKVLGGAISLAISLEIALLYTLGMIEHGVESFNKRIIRVGVILSFLVALLEALFMGTMAKEMSKEFNFPPLLSYAFIFVFPILEVIMTRGLETNFYLKGRKQRPKEYWMKIWKGLEIFFGLKV